MPAGKSRASDSTWRPWKPELRGARTVLGLEGPCARAGSFARWRKRARQDRSTVGLSPPCSEHSQAPRAQPLAPPLLWQLKDFSFLRTASYSTAYRDNFLTRASVVGHLSCLPNLATELSAGINTGVHRPGNVSLISGAHWEFSCVITRISSLQFSTNKIGREGTEGYKTGWDRLSV